MMKLDVTLADSQEAPEPTIRRNSQSFESLLEKIEDRTAKVAVVGLGNVGLSLARSVAATGFKVLGIDLDPDRVNSLNQGKSYLINIPEDQIKDLVAQGVLEASADFGRIAEADVALVCVPTPLDDNRQPNLAHVDVAARAIADNLSPGKFVMLESTSFPGTTSEQVLPALEKSGLTAREDFFVAYSPMREDPGVAGRSLADIPKVVGADGAEAMQLAQAFYRQIVPKVVPVSSTETAEAVKLVENIYRAVNIALANELKIIFEAMGIDIWEVMDAAATKPFGFQPFYPGPGLGGHCIPVDPSYLTFKARQYGLQTQFIELACRVNDAMPAWVVDRLAQAMELRGKPLVGAKVMVIGVAYKKNVEDVRESPALKMLRLLADRGAVIGYYDPHVPSLAKATDDPQLAPLTSTPLGGLDAAVICTDHDAIDYDHVLATAALVVDTRNVYGRRGIADARIVKA
ncbi:MAG TPA: nucleotide sugar dehydrogenase [Candidatus Omnitrophota bacterium]|nr:nucleotide sugar dehydrogenase [Candidatus Omnitrophota bacterium]